MLHLVGHGLKRVHSKFRSIPIIPVGGVAKPYVQAKTPRALNRSNYNCCRLCSVEQLQPRQCRFGALRKLAVDCGVGAKLWSAWRAVLPRRTRAVLARTAMPEEPELCSPEQPCPKSKSRVRVVLADDPEPCLPKQQSEKPVPCLARYPRVCALMGMRFIE